MALALGNPEPDEKVEDSEQNDAGTNEEVADKRRSVGMLKTMSVQKRLRLLSEAALDEELRFHLEVGSCYHFSTAGDVDSLTFIRHVVRDQQIRYMIVTTWCMARSDAQEMLRWVERGDVGRIDFYVGEIFKDGYRGCRDELFKIADLCGGRVARFRNHAKLCVAYGDRYNAIIEGSANIDTNPRTENTCITCEEGYELVDFYKEYFDGINSFDRGFEDWTPWERQNCQSK